MALDDDAQINPATLPENRSLMAEIDAQLAAADARSHWQQALASRLAAAVPDAVSRIEELVVARTGTHAREEDLRGGVADELRARGELVLT